MRTLPALEPAVARLPARLVLDHFADPAMPPSNGSGPDPYSLDGFPALARLLRAGKTWVKLSAPYRVSRASPADGLYRDLDPLVRELLRIAPDRLVYGSDWPHTRFEGLDVRPWTAHLADDLTGGDDRLRDMIFRDNALALWGGA
ncbi:hypothetical protein CDD83_5781 [Cordyceps sp. RAO-2017]|nr:hypothetical protein CDD83_5781 [Cordyceps sp. RAO-2017]